jgi:prepilin-type N-terminal cleavage/methylation domain-containing protein
MVTVMHKRFKLFAFSLIELMVVIAIVAVLAAISIPMYRTYKIRAAVNSIMPIINDGLKQWVELNSKNPNIGANQWPIAETITDPKSPLSNYSLGQYAIFFFKQADDPGGLEDFVDQAWVRYNPSNPGTDGVITWSCDFGIYAGYGGSSGPYTATQLQQTYFPQCTCQTC